MRPESRRPFRHTFALACIVLMLFITGVAWGGLDPKVANIPTNTWVKLSPKSFDANGVDVTNIGLPWNSFSGMVYDRDDRAILMFGGGGHGGRRGNDVWLYNIGLEEWHEQYFPDPMSAYPYTTDDSGMTFEQYCQSTDILTCNPTAEWLPRGTTRTKRPWTGHSYDQMAYDQLNHKYVITGPNFEFGYTTALYYGVPDAFAYDVPTKTWAHYNTVPLNYHQGTRCEYDPADHLIIAAGRSWTHPGNSWTAKASCWALDVTTGLWAPRANPPMLGLDANLVWDTVDNVMMFYGSDYSGVNNALWSYDPKSDVWTPKNPLPDPIYGYPPAGAPNAAFDSNNGVLLMLGRSDSPFIPTWSYNVHTNRWSKMNSANEPDSTMVPIGSNLVYDPENNVFLLNAKSTRFDTLGGMYGEIGELYAYRYGAAAVDSIPPSRTTDLRGR